MIYKTRDEIIEGFKNGVFKLKLIKKSKESEEDKILPLWIKVSKKRFDKKKRKN